jgi:hypothetical protein
MMEHNLRSGFSGGKGREKKKPDTIVGSTAIRPLTCNQVSKSKKLHVFREKM